MSRHKRWWESWISILAVFLLVVIAGTTARSAIIDPDHTQPLLDPLLQPKFANALPNPLVPPFILTPDRATYPGVDYYTVSARQIVQQSGLISETTGLPLSTTYWGYGDARVGATTGFHTYPGPTFEIRSNVPSKVLWLNELPNVQLLPIDTTIPCGMATCPPVAITTHVHGAHVQGDSDGGPLSWFSPNFAQVSPNWDPNTAYGLPGTYYYPNSQEAGTIWYHDHAQRFTHSNVWAGLAGFYLIRDANEDALQLAGTLPSYPYEVPIAIQDRNFLTTGELAMPDQPIRDLLSPLCGLDPLTGLVDPATCPTVNDPLTGMPIPSITPELFGNMILANGIIWPFMDVEPRPYRLRLLNGSDSRTYILQFSNNMPFYQIGTDQAFLDAPVMRTQVVIMPGERLDVLVDFTGIANGTQVILQNFGPDGPFMGFPVPMAADPATTGQVMAFNVSLPLNAAVPVSANPATIASLRAAPIAPLTPTAGVPSRKVFLQEVTDQYGRLTLTLNGLSMMAPVTELPNLNDTEIWEVANTTPDAHPIHLHLVRFQVLDRQPFDALSFAAPTPTTPTWTLTAGTLPVPPPPEEAGWKDTIMMLPGEVTRIIAHFDIAGDYVWHCHILSHEENDMMRPFIVVTPPTSVTLTPSVPSPQLVSAATPVLFRAEGSTTLQLLRSAGAYDYRFLVQAPGGAMTPVQAYSPIRNFTWTPPPTPGVYTLRVEARAPNSLAAFEAFSEMTYTLTGNLSGVVIDPLTGLGVAGATVTANPGGFTAITDATGAYAFNLPAGTYTLTFTGAGLGVSTGTAAVAANAPVSVNGAITTSTNGILTGKVTSQLTRLPLAGATVTANPTVVGNPPVSGVTDASGNYALSVLPDTYRITASISGYLNLTSAPVVVTAGLTSPAVNLALLVRRNATLSGVVVDAATSLPVAGAIVSANPGGYTGTTTATGSYSISVPGGTYTLSVSAPGYGAYSTTLSAVSGLTKTTNISITSALNGIISGVVTTGNGGVRVPGVVVTTNPGGFTATTNATGIFMIAAPPGSYTLTTSKIGYSNGAVNSPVVVIAGQTTAQVKITIIPSTKATARGQIFNAATMAGISSCRVTLMPGGYTATTNSTGNYVVSVPPGTYTITASKSGYAQGTAAVTLLAGATVVTDIGLTTTANGVLGGVVSDAATGSPLVNAYVIVKPGCFLKRTGADGSFSFSLPPASYTVSAMAIGYATATAPSPIAIVSGQTAPVVLLSLTTANRGVIAGRVSSPLAAIDGLGIGGATVSVLLPDLPVMAREASAMGDGGMGSTAVSMGLTPVDYTAMTDSMGNYAISVPPGTYMVTSDAVGFMNASAMVMVGEGETHVVDVEMDSESVTGESEVSVHHAGNLADLPDADVTINPGNITGKSNADGDFLINLDPGTYSVTVSRAGYADYTTTTDVVAGEVMTVEAYMTPLNSPSSDSGGGSGGCFITTLDDDDEAATPWQMQMALAAIALSFIGFIGTRARKTR